MRLKKLLALTLALTMVFGSLIVVPYVQAANPTTESSSIVLFSATDAAGDGYGPGTASATYTYPQSELEDEADITSMQVSYERDTNGNYWYVFTVETATNFPYWPGYAMQIGTDLFDFYIYNPDASTSSISLKDWEDPDQTIAFETTSYWNRRIRMYGNGLIIRSGDGSVVYHKFGTAYDAGRFKFIKEAGNKFSLKIAASLIGYPIKGMKFAVLAGLVGGVDTDAPSILPAVVDSTMGNNNHSPYAYDVLGNNATYLDPASDDYGLVMQDMDIYEVSDIGLSSMSFAITSNKDIDFSAVTATTISWKATMDLATPAVSGLLVSKEQVFFNIDGSEAATYTYTGYHNAAASEIYSENSTSALPSAPSKYVIIGYRVFETLGSATVVKTATDILWQNLNAQIVSHTPTTLYVTDNATVTFTVSASLAESGLSWSLKEPSGEVYKSGTFDLVRTATDVYSATVSVAFHIPEDTAGTWKIDLPYGQELTFVVKGYATATLDETESKIVALNYASEQPTSTPYNVTGQFKFVIDATDAMTSTRVTVEVYVDGSTTPSASQALTATFARNATNRTMPFNLTIDATTSTSVLVKVVDEAGNEISKQYYWDKAVIDLNQTIVYAGNDSATYAITATIYYDDDTTVVNDLLEPVTLKVYRPDGSEIISVTTTTGTVAFTLTATQIGEYLVKITPFGVTKAITATYATPHVESVAVKPTVMNAKPTGTTTYTGTVEITITATKYYTKITDIQYGLYIDGSQIITATSVKTLVPGATVTYVSVEFSTDAAVSSSVAIGATVDTFSDIKRIWADYSIQTSTTVVFAGNASVAGYVVTATILNESATVADDSDLYLTVKDPAGNVIVNVEDNGSDDQNSAVGVITTTITFTKLGAYALVTKYGTATTIEATTTVPSVVSVDDNVAAEQWGGYTGEVNGTVTVTATYDPRYYVKISVPVDLNIDGTTASSVVTNKIIEPINTTDTSTTKRYDLRYTIIKDASPTKFVYTLAGTEKYYVWVKWNITASPSVLAAGKTYTITGTVTNWDGDLVTSVPNSTDAVKVVVVDKDGVVVGSTTTTTGTYSISGVYVSSTKVGAWKVEALNTDGSVITSTTISAGYGTSVASEVEIVQRDRYDAPKTDVTVYYKVSLSSTTSYAIDVPVTIKYYINGTLYQTDNATVRVEPNHKSAYSADGILLSSADYQSLKVVVESGSASDYWYYYGEETLSSVDSVSVTATPVWTNATPEQVTATEWKLSGIKVDTGIVLSAPAHVYSATAVFLKAEVGVTGTTTVYTGTLSKSIVVPADEDNSHVIAELAVNGIVATSTPDIAYVKVTATTADGKQDTVFVWNKCTITPPAGPVYGKITAQTITATLNCEGTGADVTVYLLDKNGEEIGKQTVNIDAAEKQFTITATLGDLAVYTLKTEFGQTATFETVRKDITSDISTVTVNTHELTQQPQAGATVAVKMTFDVNTATDTYRYFDVKMNVLVDGNPTFYLYRINISPDVQETSTNVIIDVPATPNTTFGIDLIAPVDEAPIKLWAKWAVTVTPATITAKSVAQTVTVTVKNENNVAADGATVTLYDPNGATVAIENVSTDGSGKAVFTATFDKVGTYKFVTKYGNAAELQVGAAVITPSITNVSISPEKFYKNIDAIGKVITVTVKATATEETFAQKGYIIVELKDATTTLASKTLEALFIPGATQAEVSATFAVTSTPEKELKVVVNGDEKVLWKFVSMEIKAQSDHQYIRKDDVVTVTGTVTDYTGAAVNGAIVGIFAPGATEALKTVTTATDGTFTATFVAPSVGTYIVKVTDPYYAAEMFDVYANEVTENAKTLSIDVDTYKDGLVAGATVSVAVTVEIETATEIVVKVPVDIIFAYDGTESVVANETIVIPANATVATKSYSVVVPVTPSNYIDVKVKSGTVADIKELWRKLNITIADISDAYVGYGLTVTGTVTDYTGAAVNGAIVGIFAPGATEALKTVTTATDGTFTATFIPANAGTYTVKVIDPYYSETTFEVESVPTVNKAADAVNVAVSGVADLPDVLSALFDIPFGSMPYEFSATVVVSIDTATVVKIVAPVTVQLVMDGTVITSTTSNVEFEPGEIEKTIVIPFAITKEDGIPTSYVKVKATSGSVNAEGYVYAKAEIAVPAEVTEGDVVTGTLTVADGQDHTVTVIDPAGNAYTVTTSAGEFTFTASVVGTWTVKAAGDYFYAETQFTVKPAEVIMNVALKKGINLVTIPVDTASTVEDIFAGAYVFKYTGGKFVRVTTEVPAWGATYLVYLLGSDKTVAIVGKPVDDTYQVTVQKGINLVGNPYVEEYEIEKIKVAGQSILTNSNIIVFRYSNGKFDRITSNVSLKKAEGLLIYVLTGAYTLVFTK